MVKKGSKKSSKKNELSIVSQPTDFFKQQVTRALQNQKVRVDPNTEYYLVDLLTRFMRPESLFAVDEDGNKRQEVLALLLTRALSGADSQHKQRDLRRLGDVSLYTAGFFSESLSRKVVDVDYYIGMGRSAYHNLANISFDALFQKVFVELAQQFHRFVDVFAEVSEASSFKEAKDILRLYELWLKTRSEWAEKTLKEAGIIPNSVIKPDYQ